MMNPLKYQLGQRQQSIRGSLRLCLATMLLVTACSPSADFSTESNGTAVQFASVAVSSDGPYTRSVTAITTGKLGVFRTTHNSYTVQNNVEYGYNGSIWSSAVPMAVGTSNAHLIVYYPYLAAGITYASNPDAITINSQKYTKEQDLCYDTLYDVSTTNYKLNPVLKHAYAKLTFVIRKKDATYSSSCAVSNISISHANILKTGTISLMKGTYSSGTAGTINYDPGIASVALGDSAVTSALMVPTTKLISGDIALSFTIDGYKMSATLDAVDCGLTSLEAGKNYTIPVTISGKQLIITQVSVAPWSTGHTCSAEVPKPLPVINPQPESNCYMVQPRDTISIPISRVTTAGLTTLTSTWSTGVVWAEDYTLSGSPQKRSKDEQDYIQVTTGTKEGNALICIKNSSGTIIWSWHIWVTSYDPNKNYISGNGCIFMDRPLGALRKYTMVANWWPVNERHWLVYQWGRKDPILAGFETLSETTINTINHPNMVTKFYTDLAHWGQDIYTKSIHDPCPHGWKVPGGVSLFSDNVRNTTPIGLYYDPINTENNDGVNHWIKEYSYDISEGEWSGKKYYYTGNSWTRIHYSPEEHLADAYSVRGEYKYLLNPDYIYKEEVQYPYSVLSMTANLKILGHQVRCVKED